MSRLIELDLDPNNPSPFEQPFLVLGFDELVYSCGEYRPDWMIDVDGQIDLYLKDFSKITTHFYETIRKFRAEELDKSQFP